jgi:hypothetical protein
MEYKHPLLLWVGVIACGMWVMDYWKIFHKAQIYFPQNQKKQVFP